MQYSIDSLSKLTGVSAFTLRNWERRYGLLKPRRAKNGYRYYTDEEVALVRRISELLKEGRRIGELAELLAAGRRLPELERQLSPEPPGPQLREFEPLYDALVRADLDKAEYLVARLAARLSDLQLLDLVYEPLLERLGEEWSKNKVDIAHEHLASAFIRHRLTQYLLLYSPAGAAGGPKIVCATPAGELHEGGLLLLAAHLKLRGLRIYYLGANLPLGELVEAAEAINPDLVCISLSEPSRLSEVQAELKRTRIKACIGGRAVSMKDDRKPSKASNVHQCESGGRAAADFVEALLSAD